MEKQLKTGLLVAAFLVLLFGGVLLAGAGVVGWKAQQSELTRLKGEVSDLKHNQGVLLSLWEAQKSINSSNEFLKDEILNRR